METKKLIHDLYIGFLHRVPQPNDLEHWQKKIESGLSISDMTETFIQSDEFKQIEKKLQAIFVPPGHFYSPIVNIQEAKQFLESINTNPDSLDGLVVDKNVLLSNWKKLLPYLRSIPFLMKKMINFTISSTIGLSHTPMVA